MPIIGKHQRRIILLLEAGVALALSGSPLTYFRILSALTRELQRAHAATLRAAIRSLYRARLIDARDNADGSTTITLSENGKLKALRYKIDEMQIQKPKAWDRKWRIVLFDIPERQRRARDALRGHLRNLGCQELQKSVFVHPFECRDEIDFLVEFYQVRPFVRFVTADAIDNALHLKHKFHL